jgi:hypothetical protein
MPKPKEEGDMSQHRHYTPAKHRENRSPKYHEERQRDVARIPVAHPPKTVEREHM